MRKSLPIVAFDIETYCGAPTEEQIEEFKRTYKAPRNCTKEETIERKKEEALQKWKFKGALDIARLQIISIACGEVGPSGELMDPQCVVSENEYTVVKFFCDYLEDYDQYKLLGHNIEGFDIPALAVAGARHGLKPKNPCSKYTVDLFINPGKRTDSFEVLCQKYLGEGKTMDGAQVKALWENDKHDKIKAYNLRDVELSAKLYHCLSSWKEL